MIPCKTGFFLLFFIVFLIMCPFSEAYIDPGTSGLVLTSVWSYVSVFFSIIGGVILLKIINPVKRFVRYNKR
jgi:hypothetical protein